MDPVGLRVFISTILSQKFPPKNTLPETNSKFAPENGRLEYELVSFWDTHGYSGAIAVSFKGQG